MRAMLDWLHQLSRQSSASAPERWQADLEALALLSQAQEVELYRYSGRGLFVPTRSREILFEDNAPEFAQTLESGQPLLNDAEALLPLRMGDDRLGVLRLRYAETAPPVSDELRAAANVLALSLQNAQRQRMLELTTQTSQGLSECRSREELAELLTAFLLSEEQALVIFEMEYDSYRRQWRLRLSGRGSAEEDALLTLPSPEAEALLDLLEAQEAYVIDELAQLGSTLQAWLEAQHARSVYVVRLQTQQQMHGFLCAYDRARRIRLSSVEYSMYAHLAQQVAFTLENLNLRAELRYRTESSALQAEALREINQLVDRMETLSERDLFNEGARILHKVAEADHAGFVLLDPGEETATVVGEYPDAGSVGAKVDGGGITVEIMKRERAPLLLLDPQNDERLQEDGRRLLRSLGIESAVFVPLFGINQQLAGSLGLDYYTPRHEVDSVVIQLVMSICNQIIATYQRTQLQRRAARQMQQLQEISLYSQNVLSSLDRKDILEASLKAAPRALKVDWLSVLLHEPRQQRLRQVAWLDDEDSGVDVNGPLLEPGRNRLAEEAWITRQALIIQDLQAQHWEHPARAQLRGMICQPLIAPDGALGLLEIGQRDDAYSEADRVIVRQMANLLALALANARALEQSQRAAMNKDRLNEIVAQMQRQSDLEDVLNVTALQVGRALGAKRARIRLGVHVPSAEE